MPIFALRTKRILVFIYLVHSVSVMKSSSIMSIFSHYIDTNVTSGNFSLTPHALNSPTSSPSSPMCPAQRVKLEQMYTTASAACNVFLVVGGGIHDHLGPRIYGILAGLTLAAGNAIFAISSPLFPAYFVGFSLISVGNTFVVFSIIHLANLYPRHRGSLVSAFRYTEPFSAAQFLLLFVLYNSGLMTLRTFFLISCLLPLLYCVYSFLIQPSSPYVSHTVHSNEVKETFLISTSNWKSQMLSLEFLCLLLWTSALLCSILFYEASLRSQLLWVSEGNESYAETAGNVFSVFFIFGGLLAIPAGFFLDWFGLYAGALYIAATMLSFYSLSLIPSSAIQYATFAFYFSCRGAVFSVTSHASNVFFGPNMGLLSGICFAAAGFTLILNNFAIEAVHTVHLVTSFPLSSHFVFEFSHTYRFLEAIFSFRMSFFSALVSSHLFCSHCSLSKSDRKVKKERKMKATRR